MAKEETNNQEEREEIARIKPNGEKPQEPDEPLMGLA